MTKTKTTTKIETGMTAADREWLVSTVSAVASVSSVAGQSAEWMLDLAQMPARHAAEVRSSGILSSFGIV